MVAYTVYAKNGKKPAKVFFSEQEAVKWCKSHKGAYRIETKNV